MRTNERETNILEAGRQKVYWLLILTDQRKEASTEKVSLHHKLLKMLRR